MDTLLLQSKSRSGSELGKGNASDKPQSPGPGIGSRLKDILKKVRQSGEWESGDDDSRPNSRGDVRKKVSINDVTESSPFTPLREKSLRQKMIEEENQRIGKAKSLGFTSIKAGLGRKQYEDFLKKSPVKPLALRSLEANAAAGGGRRSILVRMKTESSINGILLPPLNKSGRDLTTARSENGVEGGGSISSLESTDRSNLLRSAISNRGELLSPQPVTSTIPTDKEKTSDKSVNNNDDYSKEDFESSIDTLNHQAKEEEDQMARAAEETKPLLPAVANFLLKELQSEDMIERRFGWKRTGNTAAAHDSRIDFLSMTHGISKSTSDQDIPYKRPIVKLGEISPMGSMRQSVRGTLLASNGKAPPPGKLTRKATMANLTGNPMSGGGNPTNNPVVPEPDPYENIHEHYCGLLYRDPHSNSTWKDVNSPKKSKGFFASQQKQTLSAGRNINAYRPWGPPRPIDPLDAILEQSLTRSYASSIEYEDDEYDRSGRPSSRGRRSGRRGRSGRKASRNNSGSRADSAGTHRRNRSISPFSSGHSPKQSVGRSPSASRSRVSSAEARSKSRGRSPKDGHDSDNHGRTHSNEKYRSGLTLELSQEIVKSDEKISNQEESRGESPDPQHQRSDSSDHHHHHTSGEINRSTSTVDDTYDHSPPHSATKKRSPLLINFVKVPIGWGDSL